MQPTQLGEILFEGAFFMFLYVKQTQSKNHALNSLQFTH